MSAPIPVVLCGQSPQIATGVKNGLLPEYEVIHVILTSSAGISTIPLLLEGKAPTPVDPSNVGTQNYSALPKAVILGASYSEEDFEAMRTACKGVSAKVPWIRPNLETPMPPLGPEYGKAMVMRVKACLAGLIGEGKEGGDVVTLF